MALQKTFAYDELFKIRPSFNNHEFDDEHKVLIIDDFYENAEDIYEAINQRSYPMWKYSPERDSENGERYLDARIVDKIGHPTRLHNMEMQRVLNLCRQYWWKGDYHWADLFEVNCFQTITEYDTNYQHYPHIDSELSCPDEFATLNMLIYLDKEENGGTAIYGGEWISNNEDKALLYPVEDLFNLEHVIEAKFNRCVIFPGNRMHGAWCDDYAAYSGDKWRFTQVRFFHPQQMQNDGMR